MSDCGCQSGRPSGRSILDKIHRKLPPWADGHEAIARKYNCASVWCKSCYKRFHLARHFKRLSELPWQESRLVTLTLDPSKVGLGPDAYNWLREKKALGRFFVSLRRHGVEVKDWAGQIEFHRNGNPHFHLVIRTSEGPAGMIGGDVLRQSWPYGWVKESYFKNETHWNNTVGYFGKAGYFHKGKEYQTELPDYFKSDYYAGKRIARFYSARHLSRLSSDDSEKAESDELEKSVTITGQKLQTCGQATIIFYFTSSQTNEPLWSQCKYLSRLNIPYKDFCSQIYGEYVTGMGFNFSLEV